MFASTQHEPARLAGHLLLDAVVAMDVNGTIDDNSRVLRLVFQRLYEINCVTTTVRENGSGAKELDVDITNLLSGTLQVIGLLAERLAAAQRVGVESVVAHAREVLDA